MKKVVLAFSGGLGTTACVELLRTRHNAQVFTLTPDLGQVSPTTTADLQVYAYYLKAESTYSKDLRREFVEQFCWPALRAGAIYGSGYMLASALARPLIVQTAVRYAEEEGAQFIAHGCASKSNDQVRFETAVAALSDKIQVIAPLREAQLHRTSEIRAFLEKRSIDWQRAGGVLSITDNLWGTTFQFDEALTSDAAVPESFYRVTKPISQTPEEPHEFEVRFVTGIPVAIDGKPLTGVKMLETLRELGGHYGVGRVDTYEDRLIGIKTRDVYEQPAATILHRARESLERVVMSSETLRSKQLLSMQYAQLVYEGKWFSDLRQAYDEFFKSISKRVSGRVKIRLHKGHVQVLGVRSDKSLYKPTLASTAEKSGDAFEYSNLGGLIRSLSSNVRRDSGPGHPLFSKNLIL